LPDAEELHATARRTLATKALDLACRSFDRGSDLPVDELVAFALDVWPDATSLAGWRGLTRRRRVAGTGAGPHRPQHLVRALSRRAAEEVDRWQWQRTGSR
jgi:hypothetical protein